MIVLIVIFKFFGANQPIDVELLFESNGRPSGEARVEFPSRPAYDEALTKDKQYMGRLLFSSI